MHMYCKFHDHISLSHQNLIDVRLLKGKNPTTQPSDVLYRDV